MPVLKASECGYKGGKVFGRNRPEVEEYFIFGHAGDYRRRQTP
jgi:hypothetical protein